jgi:hypothetical protein
MVNNQLRKGLKPINSFQKGSEPWNSGLKDFRPSPKTEFKKGCLSNKRLPVGSVVTRQKTRDKLRHYIKITKNKWKPFSIFVWEQVNGPVPKELCIHHKDNNALNDNIENLQLVSRAEHQRIHRLRDPIEYYI